MEEVNRNSQEFHNLISQAFQPDFSKQFRSSVNLALAAGVKQEEVLDSISKIDEFFMD